MILPTYRDPPDNFGKYCHGNVIVSAPAGNYHCAIDVDSKKSTIGVEWRLVTLPATELTYLTSLGVGYHALASTGASGAIDFVQDRQQRASDLIACTFVRLEVSVPPEHTRCLATVER